MKKSKLIKVIFEPDGTEVFAPAGTLLSKAAAASGSAVEMPCGGRGTCGKCRVVTSGAVGEPGSTEARILGVDDLAAGVRLACQMKIAGEMTVTIPDTSRSLVQKILSQGVLRECEVRSGVSKVYCELAPPHLEDERAEFERIAAYLAARDIKLKPNLNVIREISIVLRTAQYKVTAVVYGDELIALEPGDTSSRCYGIAYDLGSTTIVGYLMDLATGREMAVSAVMNPQVVHGDDLVSRILFATTQENGAAVLQSAAMGALNRIAETLAKSAGISLENVYKATVVGNTCMTHLFLGIDVASLGQSPYVPSVCSDVIVSAHELGLTINQEAKVIVLPNIAGFVGSDTVGVMVSTKWEADGRTRLAVDIGTNGEMALMHKGKTYVCSAAAGPAFEGAGIRCGMRGAPGAIDSVVIDETVRISTIQNRRPIGICGSGLVDAVAQMLDAGIIDETGRLVSPSEADHLSPDVRERLIEGNDGVEFVLANRKESGSGRPITLTAADIRHMQLAKGSIHAAIQTLIRSAGTTDDELSQILLAGAFGNYIRVESAIRISLIPEIDKSKVISIGNAAGAGARLALLCEHELELARQLALNAEHLELAISPDYQMELMDRMMFPASQLTVDS
ncbi:MAG: ASKHA domain-containing protein [Armatimonadetes bacterium]|nr:ASKHA domain-containing protein [Armatimonadota bacterium]